MKPYPSTSAYLQSHNCLNAFAALKLCQKHLALSLCEPLGSKPVVSRNRRKGLDPVDESRQWWAASCMSRGMVFRTETNSTSAPGGHLAWPELLDRSTVIHRLQKQMFRNSVSEGIRLQQLPYIFKGELPDLVVDESKISSRETKETGPQDPLGKCQTSRALGLQTGTRPD